MSAKTSSSLFNLRKISDRIENLSLSEQKVHTINLVSQDKIRTNSGILTNDLFETHPEIKSYFRSRIRFLGLCYELSKEIMEKNGFEFSSTNLKATLQEYKQSNPGPIIVDGAEFEAIIVKVSNTLSSFQAIVQKIFLKGVQDALKDKTITEIEPTDLVKVFKYPLAQQSKNLYEVLRELKRRIQVSELEIKTEISVNYFLNIDNSTTWLELFSQNLDNAWTAAVGKAKELIAHQTPQSKFSDNPESNELIQKFVFNLYLFFDSNVRKEEMVLPEINLGLDVIVQNFPGLFDQLSKDKQSQLRELWTRDWESPKCVQEFFKDLDSILSDKEEDESGESKSKAESKVNLPFLRHPKEYPSFPSLKDSTISWKSSDRISLLLQDVDLSRFQITKLVDYLFIRSIKLIERSDVYNVLQHLGCLSPFSWKSWLRNLIWDERANELDKIIIKISDWRDRDLLSISEKNVPIKFFSDGKLAKQFKVVYILKFTYVEGKENQKLPIITIVNRPGKNQTNDKFLLDTQLKKWLNTHYQDLIKIHPEIALLRSFAQNNLLSRQCFDQWLGLVLPNSPEDLNERSPHQESVKGDKLLYRTDKRLQTLVESKFDPDTDQAQIVATLIKKLQALERHLLLDCDFDSGQAEGFQSYKVFDKVAFNQYKRLAQSALETIFSEKKQVLTKTALLASLTLDRRLVLPIKINKVTNRTEGNSTLVVPLTFAQTDLKTNDKLSLKPSIDTKTFSKVLFYPIKLNETEKEVIIRDSYASIMEKYKKLKDPDSYRVYAGFLNGDGDNNFQEIRKEYKQKKSLSQAIIYYSSEKSTHENSMIDPRVKPESLLGGNNPAGYPKLFFFLIPTNSPRLLIPVKTNLYYLTKYTPYHHLQSYLELEYALSTEENESNKIKTQAKILDLRSRLRAYYRFSSLELDLIQDYRLESNNNHTRIKPILKAKVHMQYANPRSVSEVDQKNRVLGKDLAHAHAREKPPYLISIDLGEKHLACVNISRINWQALGDERFDQVFNKKHQTYLPLKQINQLATNGSDQKNKHEESEFQQFKQLQLPIVDPGGDKIFENYKRLSLRYQNQQKQFGVVQKHLRNAKKNLTDQLVEQISTQIVKIAHTHDAIVVFENLSRGFGFDLKLYTGIRRATFAKMKGIGLVDNALYLENEADWEKIPLYDLKHGRIGVAAASWTSKTCSCCGYVPKKSTEENPWFVEIDDSQWTDGTINFRFNKEILCSLETFNNPDEKIWTMHFPSQKARAGKLLAKEILNDMYFITDPVTKQKKKKSKLESLKSYLFTPKEASKKDLNNTRNQELLLNFVLKTPGLLNPRLRQDEYNCPRCGYHDDADYQASYNIGLHFLTGWKLLQAMIAQGAKQPKKGIQTKISQALIKKL